ncbi:MAG: ABC transporter ATP-binding protein [Boseongicola sp.]
MLLSVKNLTKRFDDLAVFENISMSLDAQEAVALTGESGSGKSTLLHTIAGLEPSDIGDVLVDDVNIADLDDDGRAQLRRENIGIVFQQFNLIPSLTVAQNLSFQARLSSHTAIETGELADMLGLADQLGKYPEQLSGGQQQRVAIGRAVANGPKLVLADEPTGNLDEDTSDMVFDLLLSMARDSGAGLLVVTHSERLAARADRRLHLSHGHLSE